MARKPAHTVALQSYTLESLVFHTMRARLPAVHPSVLARWFGNSATRWQAFKHVVDRACARCV